MKKVLVTGATGFLGNYIIKELLQSSYAVIASSANEAKAVKTSWYHDVKYIPLDFSQLDPSVNYYDYFSRPDAMIHLAWEGLPNYKSSFHLDTNLPRHLKFLKNILENGLSDLTVTGTCLEYGMLEGSLTEEMEVHPSNPYAMAKNELRKYLQQYQVENFFDFKWVRLFYMFGNGQNPNSLHSQLEKALANNETVFNMSKGDQVRDFLPVKTVAEYVTRISIQNNVQGIINCCSGNPISVKEFVQAYLQQTGQKINLHLGYYPYTDYEPMSFWGDNRKLKTILNND